MYCNFGEARRNDMNWGCKGNEVGLPPGMRARAECFCNLNPDFSDGMLTPTKCKTAEPSRALVPGDSRHS